MSLHYIDINFEFQQNSAKHVTIIMCYVFALDIYNFLNFLPNIFPIKDSRTTLHISMIMEPAAQMETWPCLAFLKIQQLVRLRFIVTVKHLNIYHIFGYLMKFSHAHKGENEMITQGLDLQLITVIPCGLRQTPRPTEGKQQ